MAHAEECATCAMIQGILMAKGVSAPTAHEVAYSSPVRKAERKVKKTVKRKLSSSGYHAKYGRAFKKLASKFKKKNGSWKKDGFKRCAAAARKEAKK
jgi:hypothetical protein